ncbi:hypothetical protein [Phytohalomonas tamaricis]|uniref:hypothetical protein n=1 Tax=Phytohalomonas tamaricis TaxID=2081032 RepID=UPI000D0AC9C9|nr:hypothetical protein [Phytohalomonas tamaricis]
MISVEKKEGFTVKITRVLREETYHTLDLYLFVPGELDLNTHVVSEEAFYHNAIHLKRTYYSNTRNLPLIHSRLADRGKLSSERYRLSLSLYAYQYVVALEQSTRQLLDDKESTTCEQVEELVQHTQGILSRMRRNVPDDDSRLKYYANIDNYLSWLTEQQLLSLVAHLPRDEHYTAIRALLLDICKTEHGYRGDRQYNSSRAEDDPSRMSNKMRLLRRLIEWPVTLKEKTKELGGGEQRAVKALATAVVMIVVSMIMLEARDALGDFTLRFVLVLAGLYALREVFKEDLRNTLWRWLRKGRPKWRRQYYDAHSDETVGRLLEWVDYTRFHKLGEDIRAARKGNLTHREEVILHYRSSSRMSPTRFMSGYNETREVMNLDLHILSKLMDKESRHVYRLKDEQVAREAVEKRYQINLVTKEVKGNDQAVIQRWKIVMNRSKVIDVEEVS